MAYPKSTFWASPSVTTSSKSSGSISIPNSFFSTWPIYTFLARHHCLHHRHMDRNFNVVFPLADYVLGTNVRANEGDLRYMKQCGL